MSHQPLFSDSTGGRLCLPHDVFWRPSRGGLPGLPSVRQSQQQARSQLGHSRQVLQVPPCRGHSWRCRWRPHRRHEQRCVSGFCHQRDSGSSDHLVPGSNMATNMDHDKNVIKQVRSECSTFSRLWISQRFLGFESSSYHQAYFADSAQFYEHATQRLMPFHDLNTVEGYASHPIDDAVSWRRNELKHCCTYSDWDKSWTIILHCMISIQHWHWQFAGGAPPSWAMHPDGNRLKAELLFSRVDTFYLKTIFSGLRGVQLVKAYYMYLP